MLLMRLSFLWPISEKRRGKRRAATKPLPAAEKHRGMTWARRLKRVFRIDIEVCEQCGGAVRFIACIEDPVVITRILDHLNSKRRQQMAQEPRAPPTERPTGLFHTNLTTLR